MSESDPSAESPEMRGRRVEPVADQREIEIAEGLDKVTEKRSVGARIASQLARAGLGLTVTQYLVLTVFSTVAGGALTFLVFRNFLCFAGLACGALVPMVIVEILGTHRLSELGTDQEQRYRSAAAKRALVLAGLPLGLGLMLAVLNPAYMSRLVTTTCGWVMAGASLVLMATAYVLLRVVLLLPLNWDPPRWLARRTTLRILLVLCVFALFVCPALVVVLLGPAILLLMEAGVLGSVV